MMMKNKKGWLKVVEAFFAVLIIGGVIILALNQNNSSKDASSNIYSDEDAMLKVVEVNDALRQSILGISNNSLPLRLNDSGFPNDVKQKLNEKNPGYLLCDAKICMMNQECVITNTESKEVYSSYNIIFANFQTYSPRKLVLSCTIIE